MKKKTLGIIIVSVLGAAAIFCSAMFTHQYLDAKNSKAAFDDLTNLITEIDEPQKDTEAEEADLSAEELAAAEAALAHEKYAALFAQNNDFIKDAALCVAARQNTFLPICARFSLRSVF